MHNAQLGPHAEARPILTCQRRRHPEAPRFYQRGEKSRADRDRALCECQTPPATSLARLKTAVLRDDASLRVQREEKSA